LQPLGLVLDLDCQVLELGQVLAAMVRTEQELAAGDEAGADIRLGATAVAAVSGGQSWCQCSCHVAIPFVVVGSPVRRL
jgi:hypothetical protein